MSLTSIHDDVSPDFRLPVVPGGLEALGKADAEIFEVSFTHQGLGGAGGDQCALDGQDQCRARVKIYAVIGLVEWQGERLLWPQGREEKGGEYKERQTTSICLEKEALATLHSVQLSST